MEYRTAMFHLTDQSQNLARDSFYPHISDLPFWLHP
jgi:hypothetical protein